MIKGAGKRKISFPCAFLSHIQETLIFCQDPLHTRGKEIPPGGGHVRGGITPAYAGKRTGARRWPPGAWDHPRIRGEKLFCLSRLPCRLGSPPHTRGKVPFPALRNPLCGITPAYAGKRQTRSTRTILWRDHPRIRGEKGAVVNSIVCLSGSPPHTRGKVIVIHVSPSSPGITPAYAGKS